MFDLRYNRSLCPIERNALRDFYYSSKGGEWTDSTNWTDPYISHCFWKGVSCTNDGAVTILNLTNNGLSGTLSKSLANLSSLEILDLSDNDIKVGLIEQCFLQYTFHLMFTFAPLISFIINVGLSAD